MNLFEAVKDTVPTIAAAEHYGIEVKRNGMACCPFREFGQVAFEMRAVKNQGTRGTKYEKVYRLTEEQAVQERVEGPSSL